MIITTINSGFGNQLFQYAAGYGLAKKRNTSLRVDTRFYDNEYFRCYLGTFRFRQTYGTPVHFGPDSFARDQNLHPFLR